MSSSAIPHVVAFLTRPLLSAFTPSAVSTAQLILSASLAASATYILNTTSTPPAPLLAASIGANIPWAAWLSALGSDDILLFYGPRYVKARIGNVPVTDVWTEETQGSVVPISRVQAKVGPSPLLQQNTSARLRATLLSARVRSMRREQAATVAAPIRIPSLLASPSDSESDSDSGSDYCDSDSTSYSNDSLTTAGSPPTTPAKCVPIALPSVGKYRPPFARSKATANPTRPAAAKPSAPFTVPMDCSKKDTTAYLYQGGVTRVMTGGVMLGPRK
ncbi:hypothetical protein GGX14DRAFT_589171 [Mycena pura]|uniref:Uncharacterized protein n=1 Tax=Mycena pura TaxID=153505 RepID=A0AAD6Y2C7_9AGAR|nr:hypothetical protein GGX14DRAFT_589171 [Mycena pura]